ncbi:MAG: sn-glycerol-1-phosphate dehydrogenase [Eubacterium sp.]|nr:sn-glycerol-1-phosphate dehydrogenase [Eubacterium sp.]
MKDLKTRIEEEYGGACECGKDHEVILEDIRIGSHILPEVADLVKKHGSRVFMISDRNTYKAAGEEVARILEDRGMLCGSYCFDEEKVEPDEKAAGAVFMHFEPSCDYIVVVGSGTLNDIGKLVSSVTGRPYLIVGTAPSMDGFASATSSVIRDGLKISLNTIAPAAVLADTSVMKDAPLRLLQSGIGDMFAKYISICEWRISNVINGEYYCPRVASLVRNALKRCADNAQALINREEEAVAAVTEGLIYAGLAMAMAGVSRPASGMEHYFSHVWDMRGEEFRTPADYHGIQCGIATRTCIQIYDEIKKITPDYETARAYVDAFSWEDWKKELKSFLGKSADAMIALEERERKYDLSTHQARFNIIKEHWDEILTIIDEEVPSLSEYDRLLSEIGLTETYEDLGHDKTETRKTFYATKDIRDKYIGSRLLWDLGLLEAVGEKIF